MLGTACLGIRYSLPQPHDQQLIVGLGFERTIVWGMDAPVASGSTACPTRADRSAATPHQARAR
ncbi:MAG: hypothetical protein ACRYF0_01210 [Janthinobacterium lividum]